MKALAELFDSLLIYTGLYPTTVINIFLSPRKVVNTDSGGCPPGIMMVFTSIFVVLLTELSESESEFLDHSIKAINGTLIIAVLVFGAFLVQTQYWLIRRFMLDDVETNQAKDMKNLSLAYSAGLTVGTPIYLALYPHHPDLGIAIFALILLGSYSQVVRAIWNWSFKKSVCAAALGYLGLIMNTALIISLEFIAEEARVEIPQKQLDYKTESIE